MVAEFKTGAVICKKKIPGTEEMEYKALVFISEVPGDVSDDELSRQLVSMVSQLRSFECSEILVRSDIQSTSNEITEQYNGLNRDSGTHLVSYKTLV